MNMATSKVAPAYLPRRELPAKAAGEGQRASRACAQSEDVLLHSECCEHQIVCRLAVCFTNSQLETHGLLSFAEVCQSSRTFSAKC